MSIFKTTDSNGEIQLVLKPVMDLSVAEDLRLGFLDCIDKEKNITVIASDVERITTPCLQLLLAMKNKATQQDIDFLIPQMSEAFQKALKDVGLNDQLTKPEQDK